MKMPGIINIGLVRPPLIGHLTRGTGTYFVNLKNSLQKIPGIKVAETDLSYLSSEFDIIHFPYFDPFFITLPFPAKLGKIPHIVTVHDLIPLKYPKYFPVGIKGMFKWQLQQNSLRKAAQIITDSYSSESDIINLLNIKEDKISVIYLGVSEEFKEISDRNLINKPEILGKLPEKFLLTVGDVNYNKNIPGLLRAFLEINNTNSDVHLVLLGSGFTQGSPQLEELLEFISKNNLSSKIFRLSGLRIKDLAILYNCAKMLILPSFAEGFGLPVLEAFACRTPVIASRIGSIEEITKNAAILVNPDNPHDIALAATQLLGDKELALQLIRRGAKKVKEFTWENTAIKTVEVYKKVLGIEDYR